MPSMQEISQPDQTAWRLCTMLFERVKNTSAGGRQWPPGFEIKVDSLSGR